jgi:uncharacterized protein
MESSKRITRCSACGTKYLVPENTLHKNAPCLKCGSRFKIFFEEDPSPTQETPAWEATGPADEHRTADNLAGSTSDSDEAPPESEEIEWVSLGFVLAISADALTATLQIPPEAPVSLTVELLKDWLAKQGVVHGLRADADLQRLLQAEENHGREGILAVGTPAQPGEDGRILFHFDLEASKVGTVRLDGAMDFKDKGEIPQVAAGDLLAEKISPVQGIPGKNVLGEPIPPEPVQDVLLLAGENVRSSADGLQVFAKTGGRPARSRDGRIVVYPELRIDGDVGLETGHIQFNGHIIVQGIIQEGYRVKGGHLTALEIEKATVEIEGDIQVKGGIIGSKVDCQGKVIARYVEASGIRAGGDVIIRDEVLHGALDCHGLLRITSSTGKILSSDIWAREGIEAAFIGSAASRPCNLVIGVDTQAAETIRRLELEIKEKKQDLEKRRSLIEKSKQASSNYAGQIAQLAQVQDRGVLEQRSLQALIAELEGKNDLTRLTQVRWEYESLGKKIRGAEESLNQLMEEQDQNTEKILSAQKEIAQLDQSIPNLEQEIQRIRRESEAETIDPVLKVRQTICAGTVIKGRHACLALQQDGRRLRFQEKQITATNESGQPVPEWRIISEDLV